MKKTTLHFKIAAWSCKKPIHFYVLVTFTMLVLLAIGAMMTSQQKIETNSNRGTVIPVSSEMKIPAMSGWTPVRDMDLPDAIRCRLYTKAESSITSCYKFVNGQWVFHQSF